jgi:hypothetical protein
MCFFYASFLKFIITVCHFSLVTATERSSNWLLLQSCCQSQQYHTKDEKPGRGARDLAMLFMMICPPFRLITALPSGSESV